jgi:hypothetical protein
MQRQGLHPKQSFRALKLIFYALNTGLLLFFFVGIFLNDMAIPEFKDDIDILTLVNIFLLGMIPLGYTLSSRKIAAIREVDPFVKKFEQYQVAMIIRWAMIEGVALLSIVGMILLEDAKQLVIFLVCILVLSVNTVSKDKVVKGAKLNPDEERALDD